MISYIIGDNMNNDLQFIGSIDKITTTEELYELYKLGLTCIRLNMSYRLNYYEKAVSTIRETNKKYGINIKLMCDLAGKEMRVINSEPIKIKLDQEIIIGKDLIFDQGDLSLLSKNDELLINDGETILVIDKYIDGLLYCKSKTESIVYPNANAYNSKIYSKLPFVSDKDKLNINDTIKYEADYIAISHVGSKKDIDEIKEYLNKNNIKIISKIENDEGIKNIDEIIENSDGIMIARGDLGKILPIHDLGYYQKIITKKTLKANKYLISATDYLKSLKDNLVPTRAEVIDLFSAYNDGIKNIMFSKELLLSIDKINFLNTANNIYKSYQKYIENNSELFRKE